MLPSIRWCGTQFWCDSQCWDCNPPQTDSCYWCVPTGDAACQDTQDCY